MEQAKSLAPHQEIDNNIAVICNIDDSEVKREERHLRYWVVKVLVLTLALLSIFTAGTFLYVFAVQGTSIDGGIVGSFLQAITEIIHVMSVPAS